MSITVHPIASGSAGNAIVLRDGQSPLGEGILLDCGLPWPAIQRALGFKSYLLDGVLVSHEHADHARGVAGALRAGVRVFGSPGTKAALAEDGFEMVPVGEEQCLRGHWRIRSFPMSHPGAAEPVGFVVGVPSGDVAAYICDTAFVHHRIQGVTHWLVEANYDPRLLAKSGLDEGQARHIVGGHMSISETIELLGANDLGAAREIWLLHLSDRHSDAEDFRSRVMRATGVPTKVAPARSSHRKDREVKA